MKRCFSLLIGSVGLGLCFHSQSAEFKFPNHTFTLPDGFVIEQVAGPPLVNRPIEADFDEQGRLYISDSSGSTEKAEKQLQEKSHRIVRLEDSNGDGTFDQSVVFADKMMFPEGVLWFEGAVYSGAPPTIWKLEDTDGDGTADRRTEWHEGKTLTGCANDLHGPYLGPDGWIYWCKGAFAKQTYERPGRSTISDSAAHVFRCRPDHSEFESVMSGGMDNPVGIAFSAEGELFFTTTFFNHPEAGKRDALVHCIYGAVYPKVHGVLDGLKRTGDLLPPLTHLGPAVPCGLARYSSRAFGDEYQGNLFSCQFNLRKIQRHILEPFGATFRSRDSDFLVSDNPDFHPTDVLEDADGSLIVLDTGGWYKICCPTSQIPKPEVLGAVYRIRRIGAPTVSDPRSLKLAWGKLEPRALVQLLDDHRSAVRTRAIAELGKLGNPAVGILKSVIARKDSVEARRNAIWALTRIDGPAAREAVRAALADPDASVQQTAVHCVSMHRDATAVPRLLEILRTGAPHLQRNAAAALGRIGDKSAVPSLLAAIEELGRNIGKNSTQALAAVPFSPADRVMEHALIYALIEIGDRQGLRHALTGGPAIQQGSSGAQASHAADRFQVRTALIALDQMDGGDLTPKDVLPHLHSNDRLLKETASWIAGHHSEWGKDLSDFFRQQLLQSDLPADESSELQRQLVEFTRDQTIQHLIAQMSGDPGTSLATRQLLLRVMAKAPLKEMPAIWRSELQRSLADAQPTIVRGAVATVRALPLGKTNATEFVETLLRLAEDKKVPADLKLEALAALPNNTGGISQEILDFLRAGLASTKPPLERATAATVLGRLKLDDVELLSLAESLESAGPMELSKLIGAFERTTNEVLGLKLVSSLKKSAGLPGLRADVIQPVLKKCGTAVQEQGEELLGMLNANLAQQKSRLQELQSGLGGGDRDRGRRVFESQKTACSTCHQVGYLGGRIGPDLTRIGAVRTEQDLLEAVVYPSASFVRSYETMSVRTKDGEDYSGVMRQEGADSLVLITGANAEQRLALSEVTEMRPGTLSIMPEGMDQQLSNQELADLVAFLRSLK